MYFRINEVSREIRGLYYVDVDFWNTQADFNANQLPIASEDFRMQLDLFDIVTNANGWWLTTGNSPVNPKTVIDFKQYQWQYALRNQSSATLTATIKANIARFIDVEIVGKNFRGSRKTPSIVRNQTDPHGTLAKITALTNFSGAA